MMTLFQTTNGSIGLNHLCWVLYIHADSCVLQRPKNSTVETKINLKIIFFSLSNSPSLFVWNNGSNFPRIVWLHAGKWELESVSSQFLQHVLFLAESTGLLFEDVCPILVVNKKISFEQQQSTICTNGQVSSGFFFEDYQRMLPTIAFLYNK